MIQHWRRMLAVWGSPGEYNHLGLDTTAYKAKAISRARPATKLLAMVWLLSHLMSLN